jgi:hypothetical protein
MSRVALGLALIALAVAADAGARPLAAQGSSPQPCATVDGPEWTQTINLTAHQAPPKAPQLQVIGGTRYYVFIDHTRCAWAKGYVASLLQLRTVAKMRAASPPGFLCRARPEGWFLDPVNGDAVRRVLPSSSVGTCSTQKTDAVPGVTYHTFWWSPAKPCRADFNTETCRH